MSTEFEEALRAQLHQAVDTVEAPTAALIRAARQRGIRSLRRKRLLRATPLLVAAAAVTAVALLASTRTPSTRPITTTASVRPATELAEKLAASLPARLQQQVVEGSLANKDFAGGRFGLLITEDTLGRVMFRVSVVRSSSDLGHPAPPNHVGLSPRSVSPDPQENR